MPHSTWRLQSLAMGDEFRTIVLDDTLRQGIANGGRIIAVYGRITYYDVFGVQHWTQFCMGTGSAIRLPAVRSV